MQYLITFYSRPEQLVMSYLVVFWALLSAMRLQIHDPGFNPSQEICLQVVVGDGIFHSFFAITSNQKERVTSLRMWLQYIQTPPGKYHSSDSAFCSCVYLCLVPNGDKVITTMVTRPLDDCTRFGQSVVADSQPLGLLYVGVGMGAFRWLQKHFCSPVSAVRPGYDDKYRSRSCRFVQRQKLLPHWHRLSRNVLFI